MSIKPWKKIKEEQVYNGYRKIVRKTFLMPNGKESDFDILRVGHAVCVLALTPDNKFVLTREYRQGPEKLMTELPGGGSSYEDDPAEIIRKELLEETGYTGDFTFIGESWDGAYSELKRYHFIATNCKKIAEPANVEPEEFTEPVLLDLKELKELIKSGEFTDSETALRGLIYLKML